MLILNKINYSGKLFIFRLNIFPYFLCIFFYLLSFNKTIFYLSLYKEMILSALPFREDT